MFLLDKKVVFKFANILASSYYLDFINYLTGIQRAAIDKRNRDNPQKILAIQHALLIHETNIWKLIKEGRSLAKELRLKKSLTPNELNELEGIEDHIFIHEQVIRVSRTIADGIAWRLLNFNRTFLSSSARGYGAGDPDASGKSKPELQWCYSIHSKFGSFVLLNDLTRYLRVGDLLEIRPNGKVILHEVKGEKLINIFSILQKDTKKKLSNQEKRLFELQDIIITGNATVQGVAVRTQQLTLEFQTHLSKVQSLIKESSKSIVAYAKFEPFLTVEVVNYLAVKQLKETDPERVKKRMYIPDDETPVLIHSSWDTFFNDPQGNFVRSVPPYSIFPLSSKDASFMMSGHYCIKTYLDIEKFKHAFEAAGYTIEDPDEDKLDKSLEWYDKNRQKMFGKNNSLYEQNNPDVGLFTIHKGAFSLEITSVHYSKITSEFMTFGNFLQMLDEMYNVASSVKKTELYFPRFKNETNYWK